MPKSLAIMASVLGIVGTLLFFYLVTKQQDSYTSTYAWLSLIAVMLAWPARKILDGRTPWYSPHAFVLFTFFMYFIVGSTVAVYYRVPSISTEEPHRAADLNLGMAAVVVAILAYLIGFKIGPKPTFLPARFEWFLTDTEQVQRNFNTFAIGIFGIGMLAWVYVFFVAGGLGGHLQNIQHRTETMGMAGGLAYHFTKWAAAGALLYFARNGLNVISLAMAGALTFLLFIFGSRNLVGMFILGGLIIYHIRFRKIPWFVWVALPPLMVFVVTFMGLIRRAGGSFARAQHMYSRATDSLEGRLISAFGDFTFITEITDVVINWGDRIPFMHGRTLTSVLYIVPNKVWSNKTKHITDASAEYMKELTPQLEKVSVGPTLLGEFFINFGWPGMFFGGLILGLVIAPIHSVLTKSPLRSYQVFYCVFLAFFSPQIITFIKHSSIELTAYPYILLPIIIPYLPNLGFLSNPPQNASEYHA